MVIEPGELGDSDVTRVSVTGQGDGKDAFAVPARLAHQGVAGAIRKGDIADENVDWRFGVKQLQATL